MIIDEVIYGENEVLGFRGTNGFSLTLGSSAWRLGKDDEYYLGRKDYYFGYTEGRGGELKKRLSEPIGEKLKSIGVDQFKMDARLEFGGGYFLEIFSHSGHDPWRMSHKGKTFLSADVGTSAQP